SYDEIQTRFPEMFQLWMEQPTAVRFPNGEDFPGMRRRVVNAVDMVVTRHSAKSIAVVTHAGVVRLLIAEALSIPDSRIFRLAQRYGALNRIDYSDHGAIVQLINDCPTIKDEVQL